jgi:hypothetical protein
VETREPPPPSDLVFLSERDPDVAIEIRVNFGLFAGRDVTQREIDRLAIWLLDEVDSLTIVSEQRHQIGRTGGGSIHQIRVEIAKQDVPESNGQRRELEQRLIERLDYWARRCFADRHNELEDA